LLLAKIRFNARNPLPDFTDPAFESGTPGHGAGNWTTARQTFAQENVPCCRPLRSLNETLTPILWNFCTSRSAGLLRIAHGPLTDRELYAELWQHGLRELRICPDEARAAAGFPRFSAVGRGRHATLAALFCHRRKNAPNIRRIAKDTIPQKKSRPAIATGVSEGAFLNRTQVSRYSFQL